MYECKGSQSSLVIIAQPLIPPSRGIVIMGSGIDDTVSDMVMGQIGIAGTGAKGKPADTALDSLRQ